MAVLSIPSTFQKKGPRWGGALVSVSHFSGGHVGVIIVGLVGVIVNHCDLVWKLKVVSSCTCSEY